MTTLSVLICDDDPMIGDALHEVLDAEPDLTVIAVARTVQDAIALAEHHTPDIAILDVRMPGGGGAHVARELRRRSPTTRLLAFSAHPDPTAIADMRRAGITEYITKGAPNTDIINAIHRTAHTPAQP
jgi:DNA-binding NarL/FixJ family response regulator